MNGRERDTAWSYVLLGAGYTALALLFTYPLVLHFTTHYVGDAAGDAPIYVWDLWWVDKSLTGLSNPFWTDYLFYPVGVDLSLHTLAFLHGVLFVPLSRLVGAVAGSNLVVLATFPASALAAFALAREVGAGRGGAFLAGLAFGFCPYRLARLAGHYDLLSTEWIPVYLLFLLRALKDDRPSWRWVAGTGVVAALCGYTTLTYFVFTVMVTGLYGLWTGRWARVLAIEVVAIGLLAPLLLSIYSTLTVSRYPEYAGAERYGADLLAYVLPSPRQNLLGFLGKSFDSNVTETTVFPGYVTLALALTGLAYHRRGYGFWVLLGGVAFVMSLGSSLAVFGERTAIPLPFAIVEALPVLHHMRAPARFSILLTLALSVFVALSWRTTKRAPTTVAAGLLALELLSLPTPLFPGGAPEAVRRLAEEPGDFTVLEIPGIDQAAARIMYHQTLHQKRIFMGGVARVPLDKTSYYLGLPLVRPLIDLRKEKLSLTAELVERERASAPEVARFLGLRYVLVDSAYEKRGVTRFLESVLPIDRREAEEGLVVLRVRERDLPALPWSFDPGSAASRAYFAAGWSPPESESDERFRWSNETRSEILFRLPSDESLSVVLRLQPFPELVSPSFEARLDGVSLGGRELAAGWRDYRFTLAPGDERVRRLEIRWSTSERASARDPRRLGARIARFWFERR